MTTGYKCRDPSSEAGFKTGTRLCDMVEVQGWPSSSKAGLAKWDFPKIRVPYFGVLTIRILLFKGTILGCPVFGNPQILICRSLHGLPRQ